MLTKILILILSNFIVLSLSAADFEDVWRDLYTPGNDLRDLVFDVESKQIENLLEDKLITEKIKQFKVRYYWIENNYDLEIIVSGDLSKRTKKVIKDEFKDKIQLVVGNDFDQFVQEYEFKGIAKGWYVWIDPTELKEIKKIKVKRQKKQILIEQHKNSKDKFKTIMNLTKTPWSSEKFVIKNIEREIHEGINNVKVKSELKYTKINGVWLPETLVTETFQLLDFKRSNDVNRKIKVVYHFKNYKINTADALRWFSVR